MKTENGMDRQPPEERAKDLGRYAKARMKKTVKGKISLKVRVILSTILILLLIFMLLFFPFTTFDLQKQHAKGMAQTIYDELEVDSLLDFIEIKGDDKEGFYYDFVEGADEKLAELVKKLKREGSKSITLDLLKKMIKAEVVNQFPLLKGSVSGGGSGGSASGYTGDTIAEKTWNFLIGQGFSEIAVAGLMGNIHQESGGFNPAIVENGGSGEGIGLIQWSYGRRTQLENYAIAMGKHWTDVDVQLDFLLMEMTPGGSQYASFQFIPASSYEQWKNASSPEEAARIFSEAFERPGTPMMENRIHWANVYYEQFQGTFTPADEESESGYAEVPKLYQGNYAHITFSKGGTVADYGCGFVCTAMVLSYLTGSEVTVEEVVDWGGDTYFNGSGADGPLFAAAAAEWDVGDVQTATKNDKDEVRDALRNGSPIIAYMAPGIFTDTGHFIVLTGIDENDKVSINDPGDASKEKTTWDLDVILDNAHYDGFWIFDGTYSNVNLGEFQGTIRIRRVTPNKNIGEAKNTSTGSSEVMSNSTGDESEIQEYIDETATEGVWSVYAKNLDSNSIKVNINNKQMQSASLIKLFIMATAYEEIEKGTLNKSEVIDDIRIMINRSDNDAANRMIDRLGFDKINNYISTHGYTSTQIHRKMLQGTENGDNYTSVLDVGKLLEEMYRGRCVSESASQEMIEILKSQTLTSKIPAGVPSGVQTANKTGELSTVENDAAIVYKEGAPYVVVIMSNELTNTAEARNNIKEMSSMIYDMIDTSSSSAGGTNANAEHKVAIVAGHGISRDAGTSEEVANKTKYYTTGNSGQTPSGETWREYQITKKVADYVEQYLGPYSSEVSVVQVGYSEPNWERMQLAKDQGVDAYVGIHFNGSEDTSTNGVSAYYTSGDTESQSFANIFTKNVAEYMKLENKGVMANTGSNSEIGSSSEWGFPSVLVEGGYMTNASDMEVIGAENEAGLKKYAKGIASAILEYYGIENMGVDGVSNVMSTTSKSTGINSKIYDLRYVSPEKFQEYVDTNSRQALRTYTLEPKTYKLIVANWSFTTDGGLKIEASNPINYRAVLNKYTMPIEYMIDFLVHTDDAELVSKLADLALDSEYVIAIQDNVTTVQTTVEVQERTYRQTSTPGVGDGYYISDFVDWHTVSTSVNVQETVSNEIELTYADSWFVKFWKSSSYSTMSFTQLSVDGNDLTADQGELIGNCLITEYCYACNDDGSGNFGTTATASGRPATENLTVAVHPDMFHSAGSHLQNGDYIIIEGNVYRVDDVGPTWRPTMWVDMYVPTNNGACACDRSESGVPVYVATNVREAGSEEDTETDEDELTGEQKNKLIKGINTTASVYGEVSDTTNVTEQALPTVSTEAGRAGSYDITESKQITTVRTISNKYDSGTEEKESNEQKVIDIFLNAEGFFNQFNIKWMSEILAQDEKTVNMIDLTKYLYNKAKEQYSGQQDDDEKYSFDVYKNNDLNKIYGSSTILEEFIKGLENNPLRLYMSNHVSVDEGEIYDYITTGDEPEYKMITNEFDGRGFGFNIFHRLNETDWNTGDGYEDRIIEHYLEVGVDNIKSYVDMNQTMDTSTVDQVMRKEIQKWRDKVEESIEKKGLELEDYQIDALAAIAYEYGWSDEYADNFAEAYQEYYEKDEKEKFQEEFKLPIEGDIRPFYVDDSDRNTTEEERKQNIRNGLVWELFDTGKYKTPNGEVLDPDAFSGIGSGEFLEVAYECWKIVCEKNPDYGMVGVGIPWDAPTIDCSSYVSWVLYEYGVATKNDALVQEFQGGQHSTMTLMTVDWDKMGFETIPVSPGQDVRSILQPGDILNKDSGGGANGHVQIVVEVKDGAVYVYDCGPSRWRDAVNAGPVEYTSFAAGSPAWSGIIIRKK